MDSKKTSYVFLADGFEEIEALTVVDLLRRAEIQCVTVSVSEAGEKMVIGSHNIPVEADTVLDKITLDDAMALILPGGMPGTKNLMQSQKLRGLLVEANALNMRIAAICAAPTVLADLKMLDNINSTCYPSSEDKIKEAGAIVSRDPVVTDGNITTSRGMGTAIDFGLELVRLLKDETSAIDLQTKIVYER